MLMLIIFSEPVFAEKLFIPADSVLQEKKRTCRSGRTAGTKRTVRVRTGFFQPLVTEQTAFCIIEINQKNLTVSAERTSPGT